MTKDDPLRLAAEKALSEGRFGISFSQLSDDEIKKHLFFARTNAQATTARTGAESGLCLPTRLSWGRKPEVVQYPQRRIYRTLDSDAQAPLGINNAAFEVFVYSHTHLEEGESRPTHDSGSTWEPRVINTGAWQRTVRPNEFETIRKAKHLPVKEALGIIQPEDLPACYPFILIDHAHTRAL